MNVWIPICNAGVQSVGSYRLCLNWTMRARALLDNSGSDNDRSEQRQEWWKTMHRGNAELIEAVNSLLQDYMPSIDSERKK